MKIASVFHQKLHTLLVSVVVGVLFAMIIGVSALDVLSHGLRRQLFILALLAFGWGVFCYILLDRLPAHSKKRLALNDPGFGAIIRKVFLAVFFLFPISLILYQQTVEFLKILRTGQSSDFIGWLPPAGDGTAFFILVFALSCFGLLAIFVTNRKASFRIFFNTLPDTTYFVVIFLSSLVLRLAIIQLIDTQPLSDFANINGDALLISQGKSPQNLYATTHVAVTLIYGFLYRVFGPDLNVLKVFHAVVYGLSGIFLYAAGKRVFESKLWAAAAALLLVSLPSLAVYSNVLSPEHLFILVECTLIFAATYFFKNQQETEQITGHNRPGQFFITSMLIAFLIGLAGLFRPFSELFFAAFVITLFVYKIPLKAITINLFFLILAVWFAGNLPITITKYYGKELRVNVRPCNLLVGTSFETAGQYNAEDRALCTKMRDEAPNEDVFARRVTAFVWQRVQSQQDDLLSFVNRKFSVLWTNSNGVLFWAAPPAPAGDPNPIVDVMRKINLADFAIMFLMTVICIIGTVIAFFKDVKPVIFFCLLAFFGFNLMEIVFEVQTRYRTVVMPILIFFTCWVLSTFVGGRAAE